MLQLRRFLYISVLTGLVFFVLSPQNSFAQAKKLTHQAIINTLKSNVPNATFNTKADVIAHLIVQVKEQKVDQPLTADDEKTMRENGATDALINAIKENSPDEINEELMRLVGQISDQLDKAESIVSENGLERTHDYFIDFLENGYKDTLTLNLQKGMVYILLGVCDEDCSDIDIRVFDPAGKLVASDLEVSDVPRVIVEPAETGEYRVEVTMQECSTEPCLYGLGVFGM